MKPSHLALTKRLFSTDVVKAVESVPTKKETIGERLKRFGRERSAIIKQFWVRVYEDYSEVAIDTVKDIRARPLNASKYFAAIGFATAAISFNPDERDFRLRHLEATDSMVLLSDLTKNPKSEEHIHKISRLYNDQKLRHMNLVFLSLMWSDNYDSSAGIFEAQCDYLKPSFMDFHKRIVDVGFWGRWWTYEEQMEDFDVSPSEWSEKS